MEVGRVSEVGDGDVRKDGWKGHVVGVNILRGCRRKLKKCKLFEYSLGAFALLQTSSGYRLIIMVREEVKICKDGWKDDIGQSQAGLRMTYYC